MFDFTCIILALIINANAKNNYKNIVYLLLCWFVVSDICYHYLILDYRDSHNSVIFQIYNTINVLTLYCLKKFNAHIISMLLIALNILLNVTVSLYYVYDFIPVIVYNLYKYPAGLISILVLIYMALLTKKGANVGCRSNSESFLCRILWMRYARARMLYRGREV